MASAKRKRSRSSAPPARDGFTLTSKQISWIIGTLASLFALFYGWTQVWDRIEAHWRLESIQAARDKQIDAAIASVKEKADADTKALAKRAEVGRSWLFYNLSDFRADNSQQWAQVCTALKQPAEVCAKWQSDAMQLRQEAQEAKRAASDTGREK